MRDTIDDGGCAFPTLENALDPRASKFVTYPGMTLRDYFAGQVLAGELSAQSEESGHYPDDSKLLADRCYALADAMIARRNSKRGDGAT